MNNLKTPYFLTVELKPAFVEDSGFARPVFFAERLFIFSEMAGDKAWNDIRL